MSAEEFAEIGRIEATLGAGEMIIRIPSNVGVTLDGHVGVGVISAPGRDSEGFSVSVFREFGESPTLLVIDAEVGAGAITLTGPDIHGEAVPPRISEEQIAPSLLLGGS